MSNYTITSQYSNEEKSSKKSKGTWIFYGDLINVINDFNQHNINCVVHFVHFCYSRIGKHDTIYRLMVNVYSYTIYTGLEEYKNQ